MNNKCKCLNKSKFLGIDPSETLTLCLDCGKTETTATALKILVYLDSLKQNNNK